MSPEKNPFDWRSHHPSHTLPHPLTPMLVTRLEQMEVIVVYGGRGMGKSVLLQQIHDGVAAHDFPVLHLTEGLAEASLKAALLEALGAPPARGLSQAIIDWTDQNGSLILIIDEIDAWLRTPRRDETRDVLNVLGALQRTRLDRRFGILVAGGIAPLQLFANPLGSPFSSRVNHTEYLRPFHAAEIAQWARPLTDREPRFGEEWLGSLRLASGGIPLLLAAAMQEAWSASTSGHPEHLADPVAWLDGFIRRQQGFRDAVRSSINPDDNPKAALVLLQRIWEADGFLSPARLHAQDQLSPLLAERLLRVLAASGLVAEDFNVEVDPWQVRPIVSLLRIGHVGVSSSPKPRSPHLSQFSFAPVVGRSIGSPSEVPDAQT